MGAVISLWCMLCMLFMQQHAYAQAVAAPVENYVVNRAIGGIIANRIAISRGLAANDTTWLATAANDPVYKATMAGVSKTMTAANVASTALGVGLAIAGAPVWLTIAAGLGVLAAGTYIAYNASTGERISIVSTPSGNKIEVMSKSPTAPSYTPTLTAYPSDYGINWILTNGGQVYRSSSACLPGNPCYDLPPLPSKVPMQIAVGAGTILVASNVQDLSKYWVQGEYGQSTWAMNETARQMGWTSRIIVESGGGGFVYADDGTPFWYVWIHEARSGCTTECDGLPNYDRTYYTYPAGAVFAEGTYAKRFGSLQEAYEDMTPTDPLKSVRVSDQLLAQMADKAWQRAASQPGYEGQPYPASKPLTVNDVAIYTSANPMPTLDDILRPATNSATYPDGVPISGTIVYTPPSTNPGGNGNVNVINTPNVNVVNTVKVDFGTDPGIAEPSLESPPTGTQILEPLTSLLPELRSFETPQHVGTCPKPSFDVFGKSVVMDSHCTIAEQHRSALAAVMLAVWVLVGLLILLSA